MKEPYEQVKDFHRKFFVPIKLLPGFPGERRIDLRWTLVDEEYAELLSAYERGDIVGVADAIADLQYVLIGMAIEFGIPLPEVWKVVHESNMRKGGETREDGKILKPPGWRPPDVHGAIYGRKG